jgi:hypothetical protein
VTTFLNNKTINKLNLLEAISRAQNINIIIEKNNLDRLPPLLPLRRTNSSSSSTLPKLKSTTINQNNNNNNNTFRNKMLLSLKTPKQQILLPNKLRNINRNCKCPLN